MKACVVIPYWNKYMQGFNEIAQSECAALLLSLGWQVDECEGIVNGQYDLILLVAQYREDARGTYLSQFKKMMPNVVVGVYGKAANEARSYILEINTDIDFVVRGEMEITLREIAKKIEENNLKFSECKGITYYDIQNNVAVDTENQFCFEAYDTLPMPTFSYLGKGYDKYPICVLHSSSGCHGNCNFCEGNVARKQVNGTMYRAKSPERMIEEIKYAIQKYNRRIFSFSDDNFMIDGIQGRERAAQFAQLILSNNIRIRFTIECRADDIDDPALFSLLHRAGLIKAFVGLESGSQAVLERYKKGTTVEQNIMALECLESVGVKCEPGYIFFDPLTSRKELYDSYIFFKKYATRMYSPTYGDGNSLLYLINDSELLDNWWPNMDKNERQRITNGEGEYPYLTEEAKELSSSYQYLLKKRRKAENETSLVYRLRCLEELLEVR